MNQGGLQRFGLSKSWDFIEKGSAACDTSTEAGRQERSISTLPSDSHVTKALGYLMHPFYLTATLCKAGSSQVTSSTARYGWPRDHTAPVSWTRHCCAWAFPHRAKIKAAEDSLAVQAGQNSGTIGACAPKDHLRLFQKIPQPIKAVISNTSTLDGKREANDKETWIGSDFLTLSVKETFQQLALKVCSHIVPGRDRAEPRPRGEPPMHSWQLEMADIIVAEEWARLLVKVPVSHWSRRAVLWRQWGADP